MPHRKHNAEFHRGLEEAPAAIAALQERWPAAFPRKGHLVRPLASNLAGPIAEAMGWSTPYAYAVLRRWKFRLSYCRAVLAYDRRVDLDGMVTEQTVAEEAREQARRQLAFKAERRRHVERAATEKAATAEEAATAEARIIG
jgi:sRNA-binding protein